MKLLTHHDFDHQADYEDKYFLTFAISHYPKQMEKDFCIPLPDEENNLQIRKRIRRVYMAIGESRGGWGSCYPCTLVL